MTDSPDHRPDPAPKGPVSPPRELASQDLLAGDREVLIRHGEDLYRLRITRQGKLILQK